MTLTDRLDIWPANQPFPTLGWHAIDWIENETVHGNGDVQGQQGPLTREEKRFLLRAYEIHPAAYCGRDGCRCEEQIGKRIYHTGVYSRIKGSSKTELIARITLFELMAACRFGGWGNDGEPIGVPVNGPYIPIAAASEEQAEDTLWGTVRYIAMHSPRLKKILDVREKRILFPPSAGECKVVNSSSIRNDGGKPSFTGLDEAHLLHQPDLKALARALARNLAKRSIADPWMGVATTMFRVGQESYAETLWDASKKDTGILYDHHGADARFDTTSDEGLRDAVLDAIGDAHWLEPNRIIANYRTDPIEGERYWLNRYGGKSDKLVDILKWKENAVTGGLILRDGDIVSLGVDASQFDDCTGIVACRLTDMALFPLLCYYPDGSDEDSIAMADAMDQTVRDAMSRYLVTRVYADPPMIQSYISNWASEGLVLKQKIPTKVVAWWTNVETRMSHATRTFVNAVNNADCPHPDDEDLNQHVNNCYRKATKQMLEVDGVAQQGFVPRKLTAKSHNKIDLVVCAILARQAGLDSIEAGEREKIGRKKRSGMAAF